MVTESSSSKPQLAQQRGGRPGKSLSISGPWSPPHWLTSFLAPPWPFGEDPMGPTLCCCIQATLSTS